MLKLDPAYIISHWPGATAIESAMLQEASEIVRFPYVFLRSLGTCLNEEQSALLRDQVIFPELNSSYAALPFASGSTLLSIL